MPRRLHLNNIAQRYYTLDNAGTALALHPNLIGEMYLGPQYMYNESDKKFLTKGTYDIRLRRDQYTHHINYMVGSSIAPGLINLINKLAWLPDEATSLVVGTTRTLFGHTPSSHVVCIVPSFVDALCASNFFNNVNVSFDIKTIQVPIKKSDGSVIIENHRPATAGLVKPLTTTDRERVGAAIMSAHHRGVSIANGVNPALSRFTTPTKLIDIAQEYHTTKLWYLIAFDMLGLLPPTEFWGGKQYNRWVMDLALREYYKSRPVIWNNFKAKGYYDLEKNVYYATPQLIAFVRQQFYGLAEWFPPYRRVANNPDNMLRDTKVMEQHIGYNGSKGPNEISNYRLSTMVKLGETRELRTFKMLTLSQFLSKDKRIEVGGDAWKVIELPDYITTMFNEASAMFGDVNNGMLGLGSFQYQRLEWPILYVPEPIFRYLNYPHRNNSIRKRSIDIELMSIGSRADEQQLAKSQYHTTVPNIIKIHRHDVSEPFKVKQGYCYGIGVVEGVGSLELGYFNSAHDDWTRVHIMPYTMDAFDAAMLSTYSRINAKQKLIKVWNSQTVENSGVQNSAMTLYEGRYLTL